jgi:hypothetical protein
MYSIAKDKNSNARRTIAAVAPARAARYGLQGRTDMLAHGVYVGVLPNPAIWEIGRKIGPPRTSLDGRIRFPVGWMHVRTLFCGNRLELWDDGPLGGQYPVNFFKRLSELDLTKWGYLIWNPENSIEMDLFKVRYFLNKRANIILLENTTLN